MSERVKILEAGKKKKNLRSWLRGVAQCVVSLKGALQSPDSRGASRASG